MDNRYYFEAANTLEINKEQLSTLAFFITQKECWALIETQEQKRYLAKKELSGATQSAVLLPFLKECCQQAGLSRVDRLVVSSGPGSFTSVRLTLAVAIGLQIGWKSLQCYTPQLFKILLHTHASNAYAVIDSKRGDFFIQTATQTTPVILSGVEFEAFQKKHQDCQVLYEPDLWKLDNSSLTCERYDRFMEQLLLNMLDISKNSPACEKIEPYYLYDPVYKKAVKTSGAPPF